MPSFFQFTQGTDAAARYQPDSAPLLGRFRAVPPTQPEPPFSHAQLGFLASADQHPGARRGRGFGHSRNTSTNSIGSFASRDMQQVAQERGALAGYGAIMIPDLRATDISDSEDDQEFSFVFAAPGDQTRPMRSAAAHVARVLRQARRKIVNLYVQPRQGTVKRAINVWYSRYFLMVVVPALLTISWCAIPFPKYEVPWDNDDAEPEEGNLARTVFRHVMSALPGHGEARVEVNFWFFLLIYYSLYNLVALMWITKVFNIYNLNWWPKRLGFPFTFSAIVVTGTVAPLAIYYRPELEFLTRHNTLWTSWTFVIMAMPVMIAFLILTFNERHLGLRKSLSETQRIFTTSWWTGEPETLSHRDSSRHRRRMLQHDSFDHPDLQASEHNANRNRYWVRGGSSTVAMRRSWLPASFVRFIWFCLALTVGLSAYLLGEAYAEIYLRTLPHNSWETIMYVYSWVITVHLLDMLTGWILGVREGERVGSYPLNWIFKLYYMITYQTYVRALYARLRSPSQFLWLQLLSSSFLIILVPLTMTQYFYRTLVFLRLSTQSYDGYQKLCLRNVFIRFIAENASMAAFLGSIAVLHFGSNRELYPYFSFDDPDEPYTFRLTYISSFATWAYVDLEGKMDLVVWPELLPTSAAVTLHVLQNMMFSIIRLQFKHK
ncbi:hypothetical protein TD95_000045 [Thielaviopsis punctulata]|uniref:Uncharacterized protein n=1 Tax=Thielaviopsis punctulata TaxID=72032 RepID=A0A0F4Z6U1_9PEZI|nr:hypothetical protein TD95_000045 [Thielaviopsis punctulata]